MLISIYWQPSEKITAVLLFPVFERTFNRNLCFSYKKSHHITDHFRIHFLLIIFLIFYLENKGFKI